MKKLYTLLFLLSFLLGNAQSSSDRIRDPNAKSNEVSDEFDITWLKENALDTIINNHSSTITFEDGNKLDVVFIKNGLRNRPKINFILSAAVMNAGNPGYIAKMRINPIPRITLESSYHNFPVIEMYNYSSHFFINSISYYPLRKKYFSSFDSDMKVSRFMPKKKNTKYTVQAQAKHEFKLGPLVALNNYNYKLIDPHTKTYTLNNEEKILEIGVRLNFYHDIRLISTANRKLTLVNKKDVYLDFSFLRSLKPSSQIPYTIVMNEYGDTYRYMRNGLKLEYECNHYFNTLTGRKAIWSYNWGFIGAITPGLIYYNEENSVKADQKGFAYLIFKFGFCFG